jgi:hypothetical protein
LARGGLTALDVSGCEHVMHDSLLAVATSNAGALTELRACHGVHRAFSYAATEALLRAAPLLRALDANVFCHARERLFSMLRNEAPFGPLHVRRLYTSCRRLALAVRGAAVMALAAATAAHESLSALRLVDAPLGTPAVVDAVVDAVLLRRMHFLDLDHCGLTPASVPALARLLGGSALTELRICNDGQQLLAAPAAALLADALRANSTLETLILGGARLGVDVSAATALLGALVGHASLRKLCIYDRSMGVHAAVAGAAFGALVAANTPALRELDVASGELGDDGLGPLVDALPANTHLWTLDVHGNGMSDVFACECLLPAVHANSGLRRLFLTGFGDAAREAHALVAACAAAELADEAR